MTVQELAELVIPRVKPNIAKETIMSACNAVATFVANVLTQKGMNPSIGVGNIYTTPGVSRITLPEDFISFCEQPFIGNKTLRNTGNTRLDAFPSAEPIGYRQANRSLELFPTPDVSYLVRFTYFSRPDKVASVLDDVPFGGSIDDVFPELVLLVVTGGRLTLASKDAEAIVARALVPLAIQGEQAFVDSLNTGVESW